MNPKEQTRLQVLNSLLAEHMTLDQAAMLMGVSTRHTRRMLAAYREKGAASVAHGHRGRRPTNATPEPVATAVVHLARTRYAGANHTHLSELLDEREGIDIGRTTLRRILVNAGLKSPQRRRPPKHRVRRQRMPRQGMMIQMDGSHHPWLGDQVPPFTLLIAVDDATGTVVDALFCAQEDAPSYFLLIHGLVKHVGIPVALYTDRHGVFRHTPGSGLPGMPTQFSRAMDELGVQMIFALSPQAKDRVSARREPSRTGWLLNSGWPGRAASGKPTGCWSSSCRGSTSGSQFPRNTLSLHSGLWTRSCAWNRSCASSTAGRWPGTTRLGSSCTPSGCCQVRNAPAMRGRRWRSCKDWTAGCRCGTKGVSSLPRRRPPVRYFFETATRIPQPFLSRPPAPTAWANAGPRLSNHWTQGQRMRRIKRPSQTALFQPASPKPPPRASRRSWKGRDGRRFRKPGARGCRFERSSGSWESTEPP